MLVIACEESALGEVHVDVCTEVAGHRPVGTEATELQVELAEFRIPLVVGIVGIGANLVEAERFPVAILDLVAEGGRENAQVDYGVEVVGRVFSADVCTQEGIVERIVGFVVVNGLDGLRLHVSGEFESGFICLLCFFGEGGGGEDGGSKNRSGGNLLKILIHS